MTRYLIEVPHEGTKQACDQAIRVFMETGSHFVTNADWGCSDPLKMNYVGDIGRWLVAHERRLEQLDWCCGDCCRSLLESRG